MKETGVVVQLPVMGETWKCSESYMILIDQMSSCLKSGQLIIFFAESGRILTILSIIKGINYWRNF